MIIMMWGYDDKRYGYDDTYYLKPYPKLYGDEVLYPKDSGVKIQKINCFNSNLNVNGIDITQIPQDDTTTWAAENEETEGTNTQNGVGLGDRINFDRNLVNICVNLNFNNQDRIAFLNFVPIG